MMVVVTLAKYLGIYRLHPSSNHRLALFSPPNFHVAINYFLLLSPTNKKKSQLHKSEPPVKRKIDIPV